VFFIVSLGEPFLSSFLPCLVLLVCFLLRSIDWRTTVLSGCDKAPEESELDAPPGLAPWELALPWNVAILRESDLPVRDDHGPGCACARVVVAGTSHGVGTSATARTPNVHSRSVAGRRHRGRRDGARMMPSKPSTRRRNVCAVSVPDSRRKQQLSRKLWRRVVTQQKFFADPCCARPGCYESAPKLGRNQARYCGSACRQAVRRVLDRERKWICRGTLQASRCGRAAPARPPGQQADTTSLTPPRAPPPLPP
jgi:hypothetical protein